MALHHIGAKSRWGMGAVAVALACGMGTAGAAFADAAGEAAASDSAAAEQAVAEPRIELHEEWQPVRDASEYVFAASSVTDGDAQLAASTASALLAFNQPVIDRVGKQTDAFSGACLGTPRPIAKPSPPERCTTGGSSTAITALTAKAAFTAAT